MLARDLACTWVYMISFANENRRSLWYEMKSPCMVVANCAMDEWDQHFVLNWFFSMSKVEEIISWNVSLKGLLSYE